MTCIFLLTRSTRGLTFYNLIQLNEWLVSYDWCLGLWYCCICPTNRNVIYDYPWITKYIYTFRVYVSGLYNNAASWHNNWCTQIYGKEITIYSIIDLVGRSIVFMYSFDIYIPLSSRTIWLTRFTPPVGCPNG